VEKIEGDPELFVEKVVNRAKAKFRDELERGLRETRESLIGLLNSAFESAVARVERSLRDAYLEAMSDANSHAVSLERKLRLDVESFKSRAVDEILARVFCELSRLPPETRRQIYKNLLSAALARVGEGEFELLVNPAEVGVFRDVISSLGVGDSPRIVEDASVESGFILTNKERTLFYDYSLKAVFESVKDRLKSKALVSLFGESK